MRIFFCSGLHGESDNENDGRVVIFDCFCAETSKAEKKMNKKKKRVVVVV